MKSFKIVLASLFLAVGAIAVSSYTVNYNAKAFATVCYEYNQAITIHDELNPKTSATFVEQDPFKTDANWTLKAGDPGTACPGNLVICRMCFDNSVLGGAVTKGSIAEQLRLAIIAQNLTPSNGQTFSVNVSGTPVSVTVYSKP